MARPLLLALAFALGLAGAPAQAEYADECREIADKLASEPGALKAGEIEFMRSCLAGLQRSQTLGEAVAPTPKPPPPVCPPPPPAPVCPACVQQVCPKIAPSPKERARDPAADLLRPQLQKF